jgi:transposase
MTGGAIGERGNYVEGTYRNQTLLLPDTLDDYVDDGNEVRFIDAFVDTLDLIGIGFTHSVPNDEGRPPYDPRDLLKLYIYGYLNQVRTSRKLERECHRNLEVMWLMKKLTPDFWTISEFRKQNVERIKGVFREFVSFLQGIDLVEGKLVSLDGAKMKACNGRKRNFTKRSLELKLKRVEEKVEKYMKELEANDEINEVEEDEERELIRKRNDYLKAKLEKLKNSRRELEEVRRRMTEAGRNEISLTDPESKMMKNNGKIEVCYNTELVVDRRRHIIVNYEVTNECNDENQLAPMAKSTKEILGVEKLDVTADTGFIDSIQIKDCIENNITPYLSTTKLDGSQHPGTRVPDPTSFGRVKFIYDQKTDTYTCPAGNTMTFRHIERQHGRNLRVYTTTACKTCSFMARCTKNKQGRRITRWIHQKMIEELLERIKREPEKLEERMKLAEHPFGTIKRALNQGYFLLKGLRKVNGEMGFTALAYNIRRALNILGTSRLLQALSLTR